MSRYSVPDFRFVPELGSRFPPGLEGAYGRLKKSSVSPKAEKVFWLICPYPFWIKPIIRVGLRPLRRFNHEFVPYPCLAMLGGVF